MSAVITPFEGTELFNTASFNNRISQINTGFNYVSNPNLLDNWYFGNPINQRGQTSYSAHWAYTIDRWQFGDGNISLSVADGGIALKGSGAVGSDYIFTRVERLLVAKYTYTILFSGNIDQVVLSSKLTDTGVVTVVTSRAASGVLSLTWDQTTEFTSSDAFLRIHAPGSVKILAAKLELGSTQTLAHLENGNWVLNEIPDYGEQLRRCQRYALLSQEIMESVPMCQGFVFVPTPVTMRSKPVIVGAPSVWAFETNAQIPNAEVSVHSVMPNGVLLATTATVPAYVLFGAGTGLSADL